MAIRLRRSARLESLEPRFLMAAFSAGVNFQPAGAAVPDGYVADTGDAYGPRGDGLTYGWNADNDNAVERGSSRSPDARYDTFNVLNSSGAGSVWEIGVPNGTYTVTLVAGDPVATDGVYRVNVEGVLTVNGAPGGDADPWVRGTKTVKVTDGRLTVKAASGASNVRLDFIDVAQVTPTLAGLTLMNAATDKAIGAFTGGTLDLDQVGSALNVRADPGAGVGSVVFNLDGVDVKAETSAPLALAGDAGGNFNEWTPTLGQHTLTVTPYAGANVTGLVGTPLTVAFDVVAGTSPDDPTPDPDPTPTPTPSPVPTPTPTPSPKTTLAGLTLINASTNRPIGPFKSGDLDMGQVGTRLSVRADAGANVGSVVFNLDGDDVRTESTAPFAMFGDSGGSFNAWTPAPGAHTLTVTPYSGAGATGAAGVPVVVRFNAIAAPVDTTPPPDTTPGMTGPSWWQLPGDSNGYADIPDGQYVYLDPSSGDDGNIGLSPKTAVRTSARVDKLMRAGGIDGVLLARGTTFNEALPTVAQRSRGTASQPFVIGAYGSGARPVVRPQFGAAAGIGIDGASYVLVSGVAVRPGNTSVRYGARAVNFANVRFDDCDIRGFPLNFCAMGAGSSRAKRLAVTNTIIADAYNVKATKANDEANKAIGMYVDSVDTIYLDGVAAIDNGKRVPKSMYNQTVYIQENCTGFVGRNLYLAGGPSHGIQMRAGGWLTDSIIAGCNTGLSGGLVNGEHQPLPGGVELHIRGVVFAGNNRGMELDNIRSGDVTGCAFRDTAGSYDIQGHPSQTNGVNQPSVGLNNLVIADNVTDGDGTLRVGGVKTSNLSLQAWTPTQVTAPASGLQGRAVAMDPAHPTSFAAEARRVVG